MVAAFSAGAVAVLYVKNLLKPGNDFGTALEHTRNDLTDLFVIVGEKVSGSVDQIKKSINGVLQTTKTTIPPLESDFTNFADSVGDAMSDSAAVIGDAFEDTKLSLKGLDMEAIQFNIRQRERADELANISMEVNSSINDFNKFRAEKEIERIEDVYGLNREKLFEAMQLERARFEAMGTEGAEAVQLINEKMEDLAEQITDRTFGGGAMRALENYIDKSKDLGSVAENLVGTAFSGLEQTMSRFIQSGTLSFKSFVDSMKIALADFLASAIVSKFIQFLATSMGFGVPGAAAGGTGVAGAAVSGGVSAGVSSIVGGGTGAGGGIGGSAIGAGIAGAVSGLQTGVATGVGNLLLRAGVSTGTASNVVSNLAGAGLANIGAGIGGSLLAGALFGSGTGTTVGSTVGGLVGTAFGPLGSFAGSFIGGALGSFFNGSNEPYAIANVDVLNNRASVTGSHELDGGPLEIVRNMAAQAADVINSLIETTGVTVGDYRGNIGYASGGRPGSILGEGFFSGHGGSPRGGATFSGMDDPSDAVSGLIKYMSGRSNPLRNALNAQGGNIPAFATGGDRIFTTPTLVQVGESPERMSVRRIGSGQSSESGINIVLQGPNILDEISANRFTSLIAKNLRKQTGRGI
jgi:hypothetical protein